MSLSQSRSLLFTLSVYPVGSFFLLVIYHSFFLQSRLALLGPVRYSITILISVVDTKKIYDADFTALILETNIIRLSSSHNYLFSKHSIFYIWHIFERAKESGVLRIFIFAIDTGIVTALVSI